MSTAAFEAVYFAIYVTNWYVNDRYMDNNTIAISVGADTTAAADGAAAKK